MIVDFDCKETEKVWRGERTKKWSRQVCYLALKRLFILNAAHTLEDLRIPPSNRLHALRGNLAGYYSVSINMQWRVIFRWNKGQVKGVRIIDYH